MSSKKNCITFLLLAFTPAIYTIIKRLIKEEEPEPAVYTLPPLPFEKDALEPEINRETIELHYEKHHSGYVNKLNELAKKDLSIRGSIEDLIKTREGKIFNLAAQIWNHNFYWHCLAPKKKEGNDLTMGKLYEYIKTSFGSFEEFKKKFEEEALNHFGSGWIFLVRDDENNLTIEAGHDAHTPIKEGKIPILCVDVWEHAYYHQYRNDRAKYMEAFWKLVDWSAVEKRLK